MNTASAANRTEQLVLDHLKTHAGLMPEQADIQSMPGRDLPSGAAEYFVEEKGSHGHRYYNCIAVGARIYCSRSEQEFARFLREQAMLDRKDLAAAQVMRLYSLLAMPSQLKYIDARNLTRQAADLRAWPQVKPPALANGADGVTVLTFYATRAEEMQVSKWTVSISPGYEVKVASENLSPTSQGPKT